jgi:hypothetical protein
VQAEPLAEEQMPQTKVNAQRKKGTCDLYALRNLPSDSDPRGSRLIKYLKLK